MFHDTNLNHKAKSGLNKERQKPQQPYRRNQKENSIPYQKELENRI
jgi:hypothetical protein